MSRDSISKLNNLLLSEVADDLTSLNGKDLDDYLRDIGLDPSAMVEAFDAIATSAKESRHDRDNR